jgi:hypothetical protein
MCDFVPDIIPRVVPAIVLLIEGGDELRPGKLAKMIKPF